VAHGTPHENFTPKKDGKLLSKINRTPREKFSAKKIAPQRKTF
jgi:hypothetical protein